MGNPLLGQPNYIKSTFVTTILGGGNWELASPLANLKDKFFINNSISDDATVAKTQLDIDFVFQRDIKLFAIYNSNISKSGQVKLRGADRSAFEGVLVDGVNAMNATTLNVKKTSGNATIRPGDIFKIAGDTTLYKVTGSSNLGLGDNLLIETNDLTDVAWTKIGSSITNGILAPDGNNDAFALVEDGTTGEHSVDQVITTGFTAGAIHTFTVYIKAGTSGTRGVQIELRDKDGASPETLLSRVLIDPSDATNFTIDTGTMVNITDAGEGYLKVAISEMLSTPITQVRCLVGLTETVLSTTDSFTGDTTSNVIVAFPSLRDDLSADDWSETGATAAVTSGSITLERTGVDEDTGTGLTSGTSGDEAITSHSGDFIDHEVDNSGTQDYFKVIFDLTLPWGSPGIWDGKETDENIATLDLPSSFTYILNTTAIGQYWRLEITDPANTDGFISIDDMFLGSAFSPEKGAAFGSVQTLNTNSSSAKSAGGVVVFNEEPSGRSIDVIFRHMTVTESFTNIFDMQRRLDIFDDLYFIMDSEDTVLAQRRSFPGRFVELSGINYDFFNGNSVQLRIEEKLS